jgi:predicted DNA-binding transcriptional regulator
MLEIPKDIKEALHNIGLDRTETQVCTLLLKKNMLAIHDITTELALPRSSVHLACENLLTRGVLKVMAHGKRRIFYIEHPKAIKNYLSFEENEINIKKSSFESIIPRLTALFPVATHSESIEIEQLQGEEGFVDTFYRSLNQPKNGEVLRFTGDPQLFTVARDRLQKYREERIKKRIFARLLQPESRYSEEEIKDSRFRYREFRFLQKELYDPKVNVSIWQDKVSFTVWDAGLHSIIIQNKAIADFMKTLFEIAWNKAKEK